MSAEPGRGVVLCAIPGHHDHDYRDCPDLTTGREQTCIHSDCDRPPDPEGVAGLACCMACAMAWGARTTPVHIRRCDLADESASASEQTRAD